MAESERSIQAAILRALGGTADVVLWRNSVGSTDEWSDDERRGITSRRVSYGLGVGSADLVGILTVGPVAVWIALEVKAPRGRVRPEQAVWIEAAQRRGVCAAVVRSVDEARAVVDAERARVLGVLR